MPAACAKLLQIRKFDEPTPAWPRLTLPGLLLRIGDEFLQVLGRKILAQRDDAEGFRDDRDRREGFRRERQFRIDRIGRRTGAGIADGDGVAVGSARAARVSAVEPPAPATFSITIGCPSGFAISSATTRAITSEVPPAANGTIMVMGRLG